MVFSMDKEYIKVIVELIVRDNGHEGGEYKSNILEFINENGDNIDQRMNTISKRVYRDFRGWTKVSPNRWTENR